MSSVLVFLETKNREISRISWEAMASGHALGAGLTLPVDVAMVGAATNPIFATIHGKAPRTVYAIDHTLLHDYTSDGYSEAYRQLIEKVKPDYVVLPHTYQVRDFAPRLATKFNQVLISDVIGLAAEGAAPPTFIRQLLQGKLNAAYRHAGGAPCFISVASWGVPRGMLLRLRARCSSHSCRRLMRRRFAYSRASRFAPPRRRSTWARPAFL